MQFTYMGDDITRNHDVRMTVTADHALCNTCVPVCRFCQHPFFTSHLGNIFCRLYPENLHFLLQEFFEHRTVIGGNFKDKTSFFYHRPVYHSAGKKDRIIESAFGCTGHPYVMIKKDLLGNCLFELEEAALRAKSCGVFYNHAAAT